MLWPKQGADGSQQFESRNPKLISTQRNWKVFSKRHKFRCWPFQTDSLGLLDT